jgi:hypothetical protein
VQAWTSTRSRHDAVAFDTPSNQSEVCTGSSGGTSDSSLALPSRSSSLFCSMSGTGFWRTSWSREGP